MGCHDAGNTCIDSGDEGLKMVSSNLLPATFHPSKTSVAIDGGVTMAWKMLGRSGNACRLAGFHPPRRVPGDQVSI